MVEGKDRQNWDYLSQILWFMYEVNKDPKAESKFPAHFNPYRIHQIEKEKPITKTSDLSFLKPMCKGGKKNGSK
jgi:hypothetical protein